MSIMVFLDLNERLLNWRLKSKNNFFWLKNTENKFFDNFEQKDENFIFFTQSVTTALIRLKKGFGLQLSFRSRERVKVYFG